MAIKVSGTTVINDGRGVVNIASGVIVGVQSGGTNVGAGATILNFIGAGNVITASSGVITLKLGANASISPLAPSNPQIGSLWYDPETGRLYVYYADADSSQWVDASPFSNGAQGIQGVQGVPGTGSQGTQGIQGRQGTQGTFGAQGLNGAFVSQGIQGTQGTQGRQGTQGTTGTQGSNSGYSAINFILSY